MGRLMETLVTVLGKLVGVILFYYILIALNKLNNENEED